MSVFKSLVLFLFALAVLSQYSCTKDEASNPSDGDAKYEVTFNAAWSASTHPENFPSNAHFSGIIGMVHGDMTSLFMEGSPASEGIKNMAETGSKTALSAEIYGIIGIEKAYSIISGNGIGSVPGSVSVEINVTQDFPLVSIVSMIAPSPDWYIAAENINLFENGQFTEEKTVEVKVYDAGTDSGTDYTSSNSRTFPVMAVYEITEGPMSVASMGTVTFKKLQK